MAKRKQPLPSKRRAVRKCPRSVGAAGQQPGGDRFLAGYGIQVSEGLISRLKIEALKESDKLKLKQAKTNQMARQRRTTSVIKLPQRRHYWRGGW